jgi:deoxycytidylate deaminase
MPPRRRTPTVIIFSRVIMSWPQAGRALLQSQLSAQAPNRSSHLPLVLAAAGGAAAALLISYGCRRVVKGVQAAPVPVLLDACEPCAEEEAAADVVGMSTPTGAKTPQAPTPRQAMLGASTDCYLGLSKDNESVRRRDNYIPWHDYFMSVAMLSAFRSKDPNRQVGACIVDPRTLRIVGIGYNGFPWNCSDDALPWARDADQWLDTKCACNVQREPPRPATATAVAAAQTATHQSRTPSLLPSCTPPSRPANAMAGTLTCATPR